MLSTDHSPAKSSRTVRAVKPSSSSGADTESFVCTDRDPVDVSHAASQAGADTESKYRMLVEHSPVGICILQEGTLVFVNSKMAGILGYQPEEMLLRPVMDFIPEEDRLLSENMVWEPLQRITGSAAYELRMRHKSGQTVYVETQGTLTDYYGRPAIIGAFLDISERRQAIEKIREQAALLDKASDAICLTDMEQNILYWNKGAERLYGWTSAEVLGKNSIDILFQGEPIEPLTALKSLIAHGEWQGELAQATKSAKALTVQSRWTLMHDAEGKSNSILVINLDITEKKQLEEKFLRTQRLESIGALAGGIVHDINNLLTPIVLATEVLRGQVNDETRRKMLDAIEASATRCGEMVKQILSFTRGSSNRSAIQFDHLVKEIANLARHSFPPSIQVQTKTLGTVKPILGDDTQLHQLLLNLCVNARDAMPHGGTLSIELEQAVLENKTTRWQTEPVSGSFVVLTVKDTGTGIPVEFFDKIFEPFFTTKEAGKGTGLGLATVLSIIKNHGGLIEVSSEMTRGTCFKVYLPVEIKCESTIASHRPEHLPRGQCEQILLVDDERAVREITKAALESMNYRVLLASHGADAVVLYQAHGEKIAAVITDLMMPVMDGPTLIDLLRKQNPRIRIICMTGVASEHKLHEIDQSHARAFLKKPFTITQLLLTLREVLADD